MAKHGYQQYCSLATSLDMVGDRWTLLIVFELLMGEQRYSDLLEHLPGIGTNLLAARLKRLQEAGLIEKDALPPPAASTVYRLTEIGQQLRQTIISLARWGMQFMAPPEPGQVFVRDVVRRRGLMFRACCAPEVDELVELCVDGDRIGIRIRGDVMTIEDGSLRDATARIELDSAAMFDVIASPSEDAAVIGLGRAAVEGDRDAALRLLEALNMPRTIALDQGLEGVGLPA
jgi:DNA-binding HxlR family transcriptional regulator